MTDSKRWRKAGVFKQMWIDGLAMSENKTGMDWKWQAMDGVITKAPLGGKARDQIPQTELIRVQKRQYSGRWYRSTTWCMCRWG